MRSAPTAELLGRVQALQLTWLSAAFCRTPAAGLRPLRTALTGKATADAPNAVAAAALKPAFRAVKADAKRLGRKKR